MNKLLVAVPHIGMIHAQLASSLLLWQKNIPDIGIMFMGYQKPIAYARNQIVKSFLSLDFEYLLMIDADQSVDMRFLSHWQYGLDIISPICMILKGNEVLPLLLKEKQDSFEYEIIKDYMPGQFIAVDAVGTGCIMIARKVFETMPAPWFEYLFDAEGNMKTGNDFYFCRKAKKLGFNIYVDTSIVSNHYQEFDLANFTRH